MIRPNKAPIAAAFATAILVLPAFSALAEKADKDKPTHIEANRMSSDDTKHLSVFEGSVVLTKGTVVVRADRIVVYQDAEGFQVSTATGKPVRFRQKGDPKGDKEGVWTDGEALEVKIDDRKESIELFKQARVTRDQDVIKGEYIFLDQRTEFFTVNAAKDAAPTSPEGRVTAVIQPKSKPESK